MKRGYLTVYGAEDVMEQPDKLQNPEFPGEIQETGLHNTSYDRQQWS